MSRGLLAGGAAIGGLAVAAGAFGAHGLRDFLEANGQAANWETAARYALCHAAAIVAVAGLAAARPAAVLTAAGWCFVAGTAIFSGCLFALAATGVKILGAIVPIGGGLLIVGWGLLAVAAWRRTA